MLHFAKETCSFLPIFGGIIQKESLQGALLLLLKTGTPDLGLGLQSIALIWIDVTTVIGHNCERSLGTRK